MKLLLRISPILLLTFLLVSCTREPPDRANAIQIPLVLFVLTAPVLSYAIIRRDYGYEGLSLAIQILAYAVYESGVSIQTNIRIDLLLVYPAIAINAWLVFNGTDRSTSEAEDVLPGVSVPTTAPASASTQGKPDYAQLHLYRYILRNSLGAVQAGYAFARNPESARAQVRTGMPPGFEVDEAKGFIPEQQGRWSCPTCASAYTECSRDIGGLIVLIFVVSLGLGLLLIPLIPFRCSCRACGHTWGT